MNKRKKVAWHKRLKADKKKEEKRRTGTGPAVRGGRA